MHQMTFRILRELPLVLLTGTVTHLVMSGTQTLMHDYLGHRPLGGKFYRNHINFHHRYYAKDHLVSPIYLGDEGNNTPFFFIPVFLVGLGTFFLLPLDLFLVQALTCAVSFYAQVFFDKEYHVAASRLERFAWFRRLRELHFEHHRHAGTNFAVIDFYWDRLFGTYRNPASSTVMKPARCEAHDLRFRLLRRGVATGDQALDETAGIENEHQREPRGWSNLSPPR